MAAPKEENEGPEGVQGNVSKEGFSQNGSGITPFDREETESTSVSSSEGPISDAPSKKAPRTHQANAKSQLRLRQKAKASGEHAESKAPLISEPFTTEFRREANDTEIRLDVKTEAEALSHVFQTAEGEFCFGIFGRWGRGKTTLLKCLQTSLENPDSKVYPNYATYEIVDFSAWKYRTVPEVWVHLYECFAEAITRRGFCKSFPITLRANLVQHGIRPVVLALMLFGTAMIPLGQRIGAIVDVLSLIGVGSAIYLSSLFWGAKKSGLVNAIWKYSILSRHKEKLGLQAAIGSELKSLLKGWVPQNGPANSNAWTWGRVGYVLAASYVTVVLFGRLAQAYPKTDPPRFFWYIVFVITFIVMVIFWSLSVWMLRILRTNRKDSSIKQDAKRVLLCVDDLDRCEPHAMLEIIESLKLLLDDVEISARLQVVFLVDRHILDLAILCKYKDLLRAWAPDGDDGETRWEPENADWVVRENHDKCFSANFELIPLKPKDLTVLIKAYTGADSEGGGGDSSPLATRIGKDVYTAEDRAVLETALDRIDSGIECGPRRLRYLLFQYQIAKLLLRARRFGVTQDTLSELASNLVIALILGKREFEGVSNRTVKLVLRQVV